MGKGYAIEVVVEVLRWASEDFGLKEAVVFPSETNHQSNHVEEKLGFVGRGRVKDMDREGTWKSVWILLGMARVEITGALSIKHNDSRCE